MKPANFSPQRWGRSQQCVYRESRHCRVKVHVQVQVHVSVRIQIGKLAWVRLADKLRLTAKSLGKQKLIQRRKRFLRGRLD